MRLACLPDIPWAWETFGSIVPFALAGPMKSLLPAKLVSEITDTRANKVRRSRA